MLRMALGHSDEVDPKDALTEILEQTAEADDFRPTAGFLLTTHEIDPTELVKGIAAAHPGLELAGSTSAAEMSSVLGFQEGTVVLALFGSDDVAITAGLGTEVSAQPEGASRQAIREAMSKTDKEPKLAIVVPGPNRDPTVLTRAMREELGGDIPLLGGLSSATFQDPGVAFQFAGDRLVHDGVSVLLFSGPVTYSFGVANGWRPVGKRGTVTKAGEGLVHEIDNRPALDFYRRYLGDSLGSTPGFANPLAVYEDDSDRWYLRVPATHDAATGAIMVVGGLPVGAGVQLTVAVPDEMFDGFRAAVRAAVETFPAGSTPQAGMVFSCMLRKFLLGTRTQAEYEIARDELGEAIPMCGFYSFGEIAPLGAGPARFHTETVVAVLLGSQG